MSRKITSLAGLLRRARASKLAYRKGADDGTVPMEDVRAVATEGALATAVDASPAVVVSLWAHDRRLHPDKDRCPPRRGA